MIEPASVLTPWSSFYAMTGSSAAALTGLMFIVITLVTGTERLRKSGDGISTFSTPTVVHFGAALLFSVILSAPWPALVAPAVLLEIAGLCGIAYVARLMVRTRKLTSYNADVEDWISYSILPFVAYAAILAGAIMLRAVPVDAMFALAAGVALLIFVGIRNAWDVVTYIALQDD
ncbi:MAG TPA: hypothetical protein VIG51_04180 [Candidatus Baltobacteraceae bacterium]